MPVLVLLLLQPAAAAAPAGRFVRLSVEQGLSQSTVQAILQDHVGFVWFGTEEGLNRYDGYEFVVFKHNPNDPRSLPDDVVTVLYEDAQQQLWVGTEHGICLFNRSNETFTRVPPIVDHVTSIVEGADGTLWVGAEGGGLFLRKPSANQFESYVPIPGDSESLISFRVSSLLRDSSGRIWIGTRDRGVDRFEPTEE
jgi:ligand-binding sensor domain-containing protein